MNEDQTNSGLNHSQTNAAANAGLQELATLGRELVKENRRIRRGRWVGWILLALFVLALFAVPWLAGNRLGPSRGVAHTAMVVMEGVVMPEGGIDADFVIGSLKDAFESDNATGVLLKINSPGGSPVQAERIYEEIRRQKELHPDKKVIAAIEDLGASAAYYIASAADQIVSSKASLVGSIGVLVNGFGVADAMEKLGIERRLLTAGENKAMMDMFSPVSAKDQALMQALIDQIHVQFIDAVKAGRGAKLSDDPSLFSGLVWNGEEALALGLIDHLGDVGFAARELLNEEIIVDYTRQADWLETISRSIGVSMAVQLINTLNGNHQPLIR